MQWFVLRVASNKEEQVREALARKMKVEGVAGVGRIVVPTEQIKRIRAGKQRVFKRKLYPGYVFMEVEPKEDGRVPDDAWYGKTPPASIAEEAGISMPSFFGYMLKYSIPVLVPLFLLATLIFFI